MGDIENATGSSFDDTLVGNEFSNTLIGNAGNDTIYGFAGNDEIAGGDGNDYLEGGAGNDRFDFDPASRAGADTFLGGAGDDVYVIFGNDQVVENSAEGTDEVRAQTNFSIEFVPNVEQLSLIGTDPISATGNSLSNRLTGNSAANVLTGGLGDDIYFVGVGDTVVEAANEGTDTVQSDATWTLWAHLENLTLTGIGAINGTGNALNNGIAGNENNNVLDGGTGADTLGGGLGNDTYVVGTGDTVVEAANEGTDRVYSTISWTLEANLENLTLTGTGAINGTGNSLNNTFLGNSAANVLTGATGHDTYIVGTGDTVVEAANAGTDVVRSSVSFTLSDNVENLTLTGTGAINGTGNSLNNTFLGNSAANILTGGAGHDTYIVGTGDTVVEAANAGTDVVQSSVSFTLSDNVENLTLTGTGAINGTGNSLNNTFLGNSAANILTGGAGHDTYIVGAGDTVVENAAEGTDLVQSSVSFTVGDNVEKLTLTGTAAIDGTGNSLSNTLTGNSGANVITGATGNDTMIGGLGNDTYMVDRSEGRDTISENDGTGGNSDLLLYGATINPLDLVLSRQVNDLRLAIHGSTDYVTIQNWYSAPSTAQVETIQAGNGQSLLSTQVDQLIQAMATFNQQTGLTWDQAIDQQPQQVEGILATSWQ
jgi:Ca2+-binding RTX toxin-like protein